MAAKEKVVNYTPEQTLKIVADYQAGVSVADLAAAFSKTTRSIIAKLSREGVYQKKEYVSKNGEKPVKKDSTADAIGTILGLSENDTSSLAKANKVALQKVLEALSKD